jgi:hypothetical protein
MKQILTAEALGQEELGEGVELHEAVQYPGSLHPESQHAQCHAEHSATIPLLPAYELLGPFHVLPPHTSPPVKFPRLKYRTAAPHHPNILFSVRLGR